MAIVTVKKKYQIVIPARLRREVGIDIGDLLEARVERGKIVYTPKSLIDRGIAESMADYKKGRSYGPFDSAEDMLRSLHQKARKRTAKTSPRSRR
jgi:AbrB family looped-hinge helix DNA binding protein